MPRLTLIPPLVVAPLSTGAGFASWYFDKEAGFGRDRLGLLYPVSDTELVFSASSPVSRLEAAGLTFNTCQPRMESVQQDIQHGVAPSRLPDPPYHAWTALHGQFTLTSRPTLHPGAPDASQGGASSLERFLRTFQGCSPDLLRVAEAIGAEGISEHGIYKHDPAKMPTASALWNTLHSHNHCSVVIHRAATEPSSAVLPSENQP